MTSKLQALLHTLKIAALAIGIGVTVSLSSIYISEFWTGMVILSGLFIFLLTMVYQTQLARIEREREQIIRHLKD